MEVVLKDADIDRIEQNTYKLITAARCYETLVQSMTKEGIFQYDTLAAYHLSKVITDISNSIRRTLYSEDPSDQEPERI